MKFNKHTVYINKNNTHCIVFCYFDFKKIDTRSHCFLATIQFYSSGFVGAYHMWTDIHRSTN